MPRAKILLVGESSEISVFASLLRNEGLIVTTISQVRDALEVVKKIEPDAIVFVLPRYWDAITDFVDLLRADKKFEDTVVIYAGSLIEGEDQHILHQKGVKTVTLGPLPPTEVVRFIMDTIL